MIICLVDQTGIDPRQGGRVPETMYPMATEGTDSAMALDALAERDGTH
jgi:hypothetical protein